MLERFLNLTSARILLLRGPACLKCEGNLTVLGTEIRDEVIIRAGKILPFETNGSSRVKVRIYKGGSYRIAKDDHIGVSIWKKVADRMYEKPERIMIVGATDTGKTTLATYLSNIAHASSLKVGVVDGDVGQGDLGPPGCIGAAFLRKEILDLRDIEANYYAYIGSISPMGIENLVIDHMKQILDKVAAGSEICVINTDGYVDERGIDYKIALAKKIRPDLIVYIGDIAEKFEEFEVVHIDAPRRITKTRAEREKRRLAQYSRFLGGGRKTFEAREKTFVFMGKVYDHSIFNDEFIFIQDTLLPSHILKGMFVGLGIGCNTRGFGIITQVASGNITVRTPFEDEFDTIILSTIGISSNARREYHIPLVVTR
ncbi:MAG: Clp1/GlmU family protein [Nitrososphaerales archaeon]